MTSTHRKTRSGSKPASTGTATQSNDAAVYGAFVIVGVFIAFLSWLLDFAISWREVTLGYCAAIALLINIYALSVYRGNHLPGWQQALARVPLRPAGFGRRGGRPLDTARGDARAGNAIAVCIFVCLVVLAGLTFLLLPSARFWQ